MRDDKVCAHTRFDGVLSRARAQLGQATLEYVVCLSAFLAMVIALGALWHAASSGDLLKSSLEAASHTADDFLGFAQDFALF